jgi:hypothetical protein
MKTQQETSTPFQSIDAAQLDDVVGGCACGCGQANCSCTNGSCGQASAVPGAAIPGTPRRPSFGWAR